MSKGVSSSVVREGVFTIWEIKSKGLVSTGRRAMKVLSHFIQLCPEADGRRSGASSAPAFEIFMFLDVRV